MYAPDIDPAGNSILYESIPFPTASFFLLFLMPESLSTLPVTPVVVFCQSKPHPVSCSACHNVACLILPGSGDSSVVRASDLSSKDPGFKSLQERQENFILQGQLSVLTLILVSVPPRVTAVLK